jgi:two-component system OmpR family response regulator
MAVAARVLVAEDDHAFSGEVSRLLHEQGYEVQVARTADEALTLLEQGRYTVVLLDLVLESSDGLTVLERLRSERLDIPVVVVTQHLRSYVRELTSFFEQVKLIVNKPLPPRELAATVTALVPA